jgi:hypothetical protein
MTSKRGNKWRWEMKKIRIQSKTGGSFLSGTLVDDDWKLHITKRVGTSSYSKNKLAFDLSNSEFVSYFRLISLTSSRPLAPLPHAQMSMSYPTLFHSQDNPYHDIHANREKHRGIIHMQTHRRIDIHNRAPQIQYPKRHAEVQYSTDRAEQAHITIQLLRLRYVSSTCPAVQVDPAAAVADQVLRQSPDAVRQTSYVDPRAACRP